MSERPEVSTSVYNITNHRTLSFNCHACRIEHNLWYSSVHWGIVRTEGDETHEEKQLVLREDTHHIVRIQPRRNQKEPKGNMIRANGVWRVDGSGGTRIIPKIQAVPWHTSRNTTQRTLNHHHALEKMNGQKMNFGRTSFLLRVDPMCVETRSNQNTFTTSHTTDKLCWVRHVQHKAR